MTDDPQYDVRPLVQRLGKPPEEWTRKDLATFCREDGVRVLNLRYPGFDGKLRELRVPVNGPEQLARVLAAGERVDGSSLFPQLFSTAASDLYVVPVYRWAFRNPWAADELDLPCRFAGADGLPSPVTPDNLLAGAAERLLEESGVRLLALAELEFYVVLDRGDNRFSGLAQRHYHQSEPFLHGRKIADEILRVVSSVTGRVKYCHSEVGYVDRIESGDPELAGKRGEQFELEFGLMPIEDLGTSIAVARWLIRMIADRHGASATFLPKLELGTAGSGMHLHLALERDGVNCMRTADGELSEDTLRVIGSLLDNVSLLSALGNTVAASYLRLVPGQEAPTRVCWGRHDRSSLVRIPLDFQTENRLDRSMNPNEPGDYPDLASQATVEFRSPDGSAFSNLLLAAVTACVGEGLVSESARETARRLEIGALDERSEEELETLPASAREASERLQERRGFLEERGFPAELIDMVAEKLRAENDRELEYRLRGLPAADRLAETRRIMHKDLHKH